MNRLATLLAIMAVCTAPALAANPVRISQVYGGGNSTTGTPTYKLDYVEIFNSGDVAVDIGGWNLQYSCPTCVWAGASNQLFEFPLGTTIQPCQYILVASGISAPNVLGAWPPTWDFTWQVINMSETAGKVLLSTGVNFSVPCGSEVGLVDKVAYGSGSTCSETSPAPALTSQQAVVRKDAGKQDTDDNSADFTVVTDAVPHNSKSPLAPPCLATPTEASTWGHLKSIYR